MNDMELLYEVAKLAAFDGTSSIWWRYWPEGQRERLGVFAECGDVFEWGCADMEEITEENLPVLRQAIADVREVTGSEFDNQDDAFTLFCARVRSQRPQGGYYPYLRVLCSVPDGLNEYGHPKRRTDEEESERRTAALRALFDAAGPPRDIDFGNPKDQNGVYKYTPEKKENNA